MENEKHSYIVEEFLNPSDMEREDRDQFYAFRIYEKTDSDPDNGMYVKLCSWDENKKHEELEKFIGKKVRVIIEIID